MQRKFGHSLLAGVLFATALAMTACASEASDGGPCGIMGGCRDAAVGTDSGHDSAAQDGGGIFDADAAAAADAGTDAAHD